MKMEFNNVAKKVKNALTGKEEETFMTPAEEKKQAALIREASESLKNTLISIRFLDPTGKISQEKMDEYKKTIRGLEFKLDHAQASLLDTRSIDKTLIHLAQHFGVAIKNGCEESADRILKALLYGIGKGHEPIPSSDMDRLDSIMKDRENRLGQYKTIVELSEKIDERQKGITLKADKYNKAKEEFKKAKASVEQEALDNPRLVKLINEYGAKVEAMNEDAYRLVVRRKNVEKLYTDLKELKRQMSLNEASIISCRTLIRKEENLLTETAQKIDQHLIDEVIRHDAEFRDHLVDLQKQITELDELSNRFTDALDSIFSSEGMVNYVIDSTMAYENMERELQEIEKGRLEGIRLKQEQENAQKNEQHTYTN